MEAKPDASDPYLFAVATNAALNLLRGRRATGSPERTKMSGSPVRNASLDALLEYDVTFVPPTTEWEDEWAMEAAVDQALATLDERDRRLVELRFWEGYTETGAAKILGYSRSRAYQRWQAIQPVLAELLDDVR